MNPPQADYAELLDFFGEEKVHDRLFFLHKSAQAFILRHPYAGEYFSISEITLDEIVLDYFSDIKRLRDFHEIEKTEPEKVAAYTAYWIWRRKPLQVIKEPSDTLIQEFPLIKHFNEAFAASMLVSMVFDTRRIIFHEGWKSYHAFYYLLNYFFSYRAVNPQALELTLYALSVNPIYERLC